MSHPISKQRSDWERFEIGHIDGYPNEWHRRRVGDGLLVACVAEEPRGWHLSISFRDNRDRYTRYPKWDEILHARETLLPRDREFAMFLPRDEDYVALHDTCFHLHEYPPREET